mmetsp:Transcript_13410/g.28426  ORF Transcript_13410/g.28426 Transcript_13410/m.28426 type:complete len:231 (-) Transcript_13410:122-814(-)
MSVISTDTLILSGTPFYRSRLRSDDDQFGTVSQCFRLNQRVIHSQRSQGANINLLQLFLEIQGIGFDQFLGSVKVSGIIDNHIQSTSIALHAFGNLPNCLVIGNIHSAVDVPFSHQFFQLGRAASADYNSSGSNRNQLLDDGESQSAVSPGDQHAFPGQISTIVHGFDIEVAGVIFLLRPCETSNLIRHRVSPSPGFVEICGSCHCCALGTGGQRSSRGGGRKCVDLFAS